MLPTNLYQDFFSSSFVIECRKLGMITNDIITFINSLVGIRNFIHNHPKPIIEYYWIFDQTQTMRQIADKLGIRLKRIRMLAEKDDPNVVIDEEKEYPIYPPNFFYGAECYGGIDAVRKNIGKAAYLVDLKSNDIVQNETLWEKVVLLQNESYSIRHSSDEWEYHHEFKTGWAYLVENLNIKLDLQLISFLKDRNIALKKEQVDDYAGFRFGIHPFPIDVSNGLMAFRKHSIDEDIIPLIINDPIQWEGIFYDQDFCNNSILQYIKEKVSHLEESFFYR